MTVQSINCDIVIAGGGLAGGLIALALAEIHPRLDVRIIESAETLGGNHIWSFFDSDIAAEHRWLVEPLICHSWNGYDIAFPAHSRTLDATYNAIESERLDTVVRTKLGAHEIVRAVVQSLNSHSVMLGDGCKIVAPIVIDARGPGDISKLDVGWQKFVGLSVHVPGGHGLTRPIVMDATVEQIDGYRFVYCLPFDANTVFIEDTYYSDTPDLDVPAIRERIIAYAAEKGWKTNGGGREETGVLPVVMGGNPEAYWQTSGHTAKAGLRAGMFHPTTGYSLPDAVRMAVFYADASNLSGAALADRSKLLFLKSWHAGRFYRVLNKMLFRAAEPHLRYKVLERFYRLSPPLIARFYAGQSRLGDKIRILCGKPPVPIGRAIKAILGLKK